MPFPFRKLGIPDLILVEPKVFGDDRGFLVEAYKKSDFVANGIADEFVQDGHIERHVRTVRIYAKTQRVHRHAFPLIQDIETDIALATRSMDASVLIQDRDFA